VQLIIQIEQVVQKKAASTVRLKQEALIADQHKTTLNRAIRYHQQVQTQKLRHTEAVAQEAGQTQQVHQHEAIQAEVNLVQVAIRAHQAEAVTLAEVQAAEVQVVRAEVAQEAALVEVALAEAIAAVQVLRAAEGKKYLIEDLNCFELN
jgi:hypothetical protein